jgi:SAM-dependent methyltransferase
VAGSVPPVPEPRPLLLVARKRLALLVPPMRLSARIRRRSLVKMVRSYLGDLHGVEIGGASHNDFCIDAVNVDRYDSMDTVYKQAEREQWGYAKPVDVVAPGDDLPFGSDSYDYVFASHVIEHLPDPIAGLSEWVRVARRYVFLVVPHRDRTFDRDRPLTPVEELVERHRAGFSSDEDKHWSVWTPESFAALCEHIGVEVIEMRDPDFKGGIGFAVVLSATRQPSIDRAPASTVAAPGAG